MVVSMSEQPHGNGYAQPEKQFRKLLQALVGLMLMMAVFELGNGALNVAIIIAQADEGAQRSKITREVVVATGFCLKQRDIDTKKEIEDCVERTLGRPLTEDTDESK